MKHGTPVPQLLLLTAALMISGGAWAQFSGPPGLTARPSSAMATGTNALVLASTASGFTATGTYTVNKRAGGIEPGRYARADQRMAIGSWACRAAGAATTRCG